MERDPAANISSSELDKETQEKLRGDCIGETLYSESFVIRTLIGLTDLKYTEEEEQDLCFLWDMTLEKNVCELLFDLQYPSLVSSALTNCTQERFSEILIGILGNILVAECNNKSLSDDDLKSVLSEFETDDPAVYIQLLRLIEIIAYRFPDKLSLLGSEILDERIQFILNSSVNSELLIQTMQALVRLTEDFKMDKRYVNCGLFKSIVEAVDTILSIETTNFEEELDSQQTSKVIGVFFNLISNICAYVDNYHHDDDISEALSCSDKLALIICKIIKHYSAEENLLPLQSNFIDYMTAFQAIFTTRDVTLVSSRDFELFNHIFEPLCLIVYFLHGCKSELLESFNIALELVAILIHLVNVNSVLTQLSCMRYKKGIVVLNSLRELSRTLDFDINEKLRFLFAEYK